MNELKKSLLAAKMDTAWPKLTKNKSGFFDYADLDHMLELYEDVLGKHGLVINFEPVVRGDNEIMVTVLEHPESGGESTAESKIRAGKDDTEWAGSCTTQRRYGMMAVLGIAPSSVIEVALITPEQVSLLNKAIADCHPKSGTVFNEVKAFGKITKLEEIPANGFDDAMKFILDRKPKV